MTDPRVRNGTQDAFRDFMGAYYTGVTIVASIGRDGRPHGLTCNSLSSVTLDPPTLLVCLDMRSGTLDALRWSGGFTVNLLHDGGRRAAELFASAKPDRFEQVTWCESASMGLPWLIEDAHGIVECRVADTVAVGDHVVVFGQVLTVETTPANPLLYGMRAFAEGSTVIA